MTRETQGVQFLEVSQGLFQTGQGDRLADESKIEIPEVKAFG